MYEKVIQMLLHESVSQVLEGISPEDGPVVSAEFERLLTVCLGKADLPSSSNTEELTLRAGRYLIDEICKLPPDARLEYIQKELFVQELSGLDAEAQRIAQDTLKESPDLPAMRTRARTIRERLDELSDMLHAKGPGWEQSFSRMLSEASMDCLFVLGKTHHSSMRLGRDIRFMQERGNWPPAWYAELWLKDNDNK